MFFTEFGALDEKFKEFVHKLCPQHNHRSHALFSYAFSFRVMISPVDKRSACGLSSRLLAVWLVLCPVRALATLTAVADLHAPTALLQRVSRLGVVTAWNSKRSETTHTKTHTRIRTRALR